MNKFTDEWWDHIESSHVEKAAKFGPEADVVSAMSARAMVISALSWREEQEKNAKDAKCH